MLSPFKVGLLIALASTALAVDYDLSVDGVNGTDVSGCGQGGADPCATLDFGFAELNLTETDSFTLNLAPSTHVHNTFSSPLAVIGAGQYGIVNGNGGAIQWVTGREHGGFLVGGGSLSLFNVTLSSARRKFEDTVAGNDFRGVGGCVVLWQPDGVVETPTLMTRDVVRFYNCTAEISGGAVFAGPGSVVDGSDDDELLFLDCNTEGQGGALFGFPNSTMNITNGVFQACEADEGSAIATGSSPLTLTDCDFRDNVATAGTLWSQNVDGYRTPITIIDGSHFFDNTVDSSGGGFFIGEETHVELRSTNRALSVRENVAILAGVGSTNGVGGIVFDAGSVVAASPGFEWDVNGNIGGNANVNVYCHATASGCKDCSTCSLGLGNCEAPPYSNTSLVSPVDDGCLCNPGTDYGTVGCQSCPAGTWGNETAQLACYDCPPGFVLDDTGSLVDACQPCFAGTASPGGPGSAECTPCSFGSYSETDNAPECTLCPAGTASFEELATNATVCLDCILGASTEGERGRGECAPCPRNTYTDVTGTSFCTPCPEDRPSTLGKTGSTSEDLCFVAPTNTEEPLLSGTALASIGIVTVALLFFAYSMAYARGAKQAGDAEMARNVAAEEKRLSTGSKNSPKDGAKAAGGAGPRKAGGAGNPKRKSMNSGGGKKGGGTKANGSADKRKSTGSNTGGAKRKSVASNGNNRKSTNSNARKSMTSKDSNASGGRPRPKSGSGAGKGAKPSTGSKASRGSNASGARKSTDPKRKSGTSAASKASRGSNASGARKSGDPKRKSGNSGAGKGARGGASDAKRKSGTTQKSTATRKSADSKASRGSKASGNGPKRASGARKGKK